MGTSNFGETKVNKLFSANNGTKAFSHFMCSFGDFGQTVRGLIRRQIRVKGLSCWENNVFSNQFKSWVGLFFCFKHVLSAFFKVGGRDREKPHFSK